MEGVEWSLCSSSYSLLYIATCVLGENINENLTLQSKYQERINQIHANI